MTALSHTGGRARARLPDAALPGWRCWGRWRCSSSRPADRDAALRPLPADQRLASRTLGDQVLEGSFWTAVGQTLQGWALGLGIATALGIPLGIIIGSNRLLYRACGG